ncbi:hypothetical protein HHI36_023464 [Cryptolaemus montrouzieri]|uniref:Uncharacterized protein n=1 Tax=Cryptolaemus montrouzieri TaxID=559131 RepID=A0ABD2PH78_9CUCU
MNGHNRKVNTCLYENPDGDGEGVNGTGQVSKMKIRGLRQLGHIHIETKILEEIIRTKHESDDKKAAWKVIDSKLKSPKHVNEEDNLSADELNAFFTTVGANLSKNFKQSDSVNDNPVKNPGSMFLTLTTPDELIKVATAMKNKTSYDIYGWAVQLMKRVIRYIAEPLFYRKIENSQGSFHL